MAALAVLLKTAPAVVGMLFPVDRKSMTVQYIYFKVNCQKIIQNNKQAYGVFHAIHLERPGGS